MIRPLEVGLSEFLDGSEKLSITDCSLYPQNGDLAEEENDDLGICTVDLMFRFLVIMTHGRSKATP
jgi:hypothetical protein